ncbi:MAG: serine/threonine protein kinase, partial [Kamptonema sp. SIO4C4]|nr:serine/threonine protein kinase [Kamptonema sp. SIO4C4]
EMLTNEMPLLPESNSFGGWYKAHHDLKPLPIPSHLNIPPDLDRLIMQCLAKNPGDRPQSTAEIFEIIAPLEERYNKRSSNRQGSAISTQTPPDSAEKEDSRTESTLEDLCLQLTWPKKKPLQKIVFPRLLRTSKGVFVTLWVMLDQQDLFNRRYSTRYNQFLFSTTPHPMLLWITVLYNREHGPRWLPFYLDLKSSLGQNATRLLGESGSYRMLFYTLEDPGHKCQHVMEVHIDPEQCKRLLQWSKTSQGIPDAGQAGLSKKLLKQEFEKLKPKIQMKLEAVQTNYPQSQHSRNSHR